MLRRFLVLMLTLSVMLLGLPNVAIAGGAMDDGAASVAMSHDCVCPPGHDMPTPEQDSDGCAPTLGCMIQCGMAPMAIAMDVQALPHALPSYRVMAADVTAPRLSSLAPPFRPPSL